MNLKSLTFSVGGVHMDERKTLTESRLIERLDQPSIVHIPMSQHIGAPCNPTVKVGNQIKVGQVAGTLDAFISADVCASVSGEVVAVDKRYTADGRYCACVPIKNDGANTYVEGLEAFKNHEIANIDDIMTYVEKSGIAGMGGVGLPLHTGLKSEDSLLDVVILNGAKCEPYLTCDRRIMLERAEGILKGLKLFADLYHTKEAYVATEENKPDAIEKMEELIQDNPERKDLKVASCQTKYPRGDSKRLSEVVINRIIPQNGITNDVGVFLTSAGTTLAFYEIIEKGLPSIERVTTVSDTGIEKSKDIMVPIGTTVGEILEFCGGVKENFVEIVCGGPMIGKSVFDSDSPITKTISGFLIPTEVEKPEETESLCIKRSRCVDHCPTNINPTDISAVTSRNRADSAEPYHVDQRMECGICSFVYPAKRHLAESVKLIKKEIRMGSRKQEVEMDKNLRNSGDYFVSLTPHIRSNDTV